MLKDLLRSRSAPDLVRPERPPVDSSNEPLKSVAAVQAPETGEYEALMRSIGIANQHVGADLKIERFKVFLRAKDWPVFDLSTVVAYMDKKAQEESAAQSGWHWRPLRQKDDIRNANFGTEARAWQSGGGMSFNSSGISQEQVQLMALAQSAIERIPASDQYRGPHTTNQDIWGQRTGQPHEVQASAQPYDKLVPLHALRKVGAIEAEFREPVAFFICDYAPAPHIEYPDPFLMVVIDNPRLNQGVGRFVIDFWDEPGFGFGQQLALGEG